MGSARVDGDGRGAESVSPTDFREVLGSFATGVSIMSTTVGDVPHGMTANAVSSVSIDPPLVLVCVAREALMAERVVAGGVFALSFLSASGTRLALRFADPDRPDGPAAFEGVPVRHEVTGSPVVADNVGWVDCRVWSTADGGDHVIVVGEVLALGSDGAEPLLYYRGAFGALRRTEG